MYPFKTVGLDAAVSLISDLEWFGNTNGHLVVVRGLANPSDVGEAFASILPNIKDRWRTQAIPFVVAIDGKGDRLRSSLHDANDRMDEFARLPWTLLGEGAVNVVIHGTKEAEADI
jgi:hypothetical protein